MVAIIRLLVFRAWCNRLIFIIHFRIIAFWYGIRWIFSYLSFWMFLFFLSPRLSRPLFLMNKTFIYFISSIVIIEGIDKLGLSSLARNDHSCRNSIIIFDQFHFLVVINSPSKWVCWEYGLKCWLDVFRLNEYSTQVTVTNSVQDAMIHVIIIKCIHFNFC